jgi:hypothetical protein
MDVRVTIRLCNPPVVRVNIWNPSPARHANIKFVFIMHEGDRMTSFERNWTFHFPRLVRDRLQLALIGVTFSLALYKGILRGLEVTVVEPESPLPQPVDFDVTAELPRED